MDSLGKAYAEAEEMFRVLGDEAARVAAERAEGCRKNDDEAGVVYWDRVTAFLVYLLNDRPETIQ